MPLGDGAGIGEELAVQMIDMEQDEISKLRARITELEDSLLYIGTILSQDRSKSILRLMVQIANQRHGS